jgi:hypothetical protein
MFSKESVRAITGLHRYKHACPALFPLFSYNQQLAGSGDSKQKQPAILTHFESVSDIVVSFCSEVIKGIGIAPLVLR